MPEASLAAALALASVLQTATLPVVELRQYTLKPGQREVLIELFDRELVETQEAEGMKVVGQFRDLDRPDRFVWLRAFPDMAARRERLEAFYSGPVWAAHRGAANPTMEDVSDVLLLREARPGSGFAPDPRPRPAPGAAEPPKGVVIAWIGHVDDPAGSAGVFEAQVRPQLEAAGVPVLATFTPERSPNDFPRLPVREGEEVFVWFTRFDSPAAAEAALGRLETGGGAWADFRRRLTRPAQMLRLEPTARSQLR